jgi:DNA primase
LIRSTVARMGQGSRIVIATDNDEGGRALAEQIEGIAAETGREDLAVIRDLPAGVGQDWNDALKAGRNAAAPALQPR